MSSANNRPALLFPDQAAPTASTRSKEVANLTAAFALAGFAVHPAPCGGYTVCRWNLGKHCPDLTALKAFGKLAGVPQ